MIEAETFSGPPAEWMLSANMIICWQCCTTVLDVLQPFSEL